MNISVYGEGAFTKDPWDFFLDQLSSSLTTDFRLLWSPNLEGLDSWSSDLNAFFDFLMRGTTAFGNITENASKDR